MPEPTAQWNPARGVWERPETNMLCGQQVPYSVTWPTSGMTRSGRLYPRPTQALPIAANGSSSSPGLLPTPQAHDTAGAKTPEQVAAMRARGHGVANLNEAAAHLLSTPQEFDSHFDSLNISDEAAERQLHRTDGIRRNTTGSLTKDLLLLKTPTAQLAVNGGSQDPEKRRAGGHGPTLADQVEHELLPTPRCADGMIASNMQSNRDRLAGGARRRGTLEEEISLLPTPAARDWKSGQSNLIGTNARPLNEVVEMLLPTPNASDAQGRSMEHHRRREASLKAANPRLGALQMPLATVVESLGDPTSPPSTGGRRSSGGQHPGQLSLDEQENDSPPPSSSGCRDYPKAG